MAGANVALTGGSSIRINATTDVVGTAADRSRVEITGGGTCKALALSGASTCTPP